MKRILFLATILFSIAASAKTPSSTWPYLYPNFSAGTIYLAGGSKSDVQLNVHVRHGHLHFIDNDLVKEADLSTVRMASIGSDKFIPVEGEMRKILAGNANGYIVASILGDFSALQETGGAYGASSATAATRKLSSLDFDTQVGQHHMLLLKEKENGVDLKLVTTLFIYFEDNCIKESRKDVEAFLPESESGAWKAWLKSNKIKWKDPQSLLAVLDFMNEHK